MSADFYQNLAANEYNSGGESEVSQVDPDEIIGKTKSTSQTASSGKKFPDFDEDDPLAGLLPDDDDFSFSEKKTTDTSYFGRDTKLKVNVADLGTKSHDTSTKKISPTKTQTASSVKKYLSSELDWLTTKTPESNKSEILAPGTRGGILGHFSSNNTEPFQTKLSKPKDEDNGFLNLLTEDTKRHDSNQDKNSKRRIISDIFSEDNIKAGSSSEATKQSTKANKGPSPGDWLGLKDTQGDSNLGSGEPFGPLSGNAGRRPQTAAPDSGSRQESRPKTAAPDLGLPKPKPRPGRPEEKTPHSILQSFMNDYDSPTVSSSNLEAAETEVGSGYTPSTGREPRRAGRRSSLGLSDPLGLFTNTQSNQTAETTPYQLEPKPVTESPIRPATQTKPLNPLSDSYQVTTAAPSSQLPAWLGGAAAAATAAAVAAGVVQGVEPTTAITTQNPPTSTVASTQSSVQISDPGPLLSSMSQMEANYTEVMSQQMQGLTAALSLRRQEEAMAALQTRQAAIIRQYEHQLNELMQRQIQRQQQVEHTMTQQQKQIQKHIQALISQPATQHPFITHSQLFMPKQGNNELPPLSDTQDNLSELKIKIERLEHEKCELEAQVEKERKRFENREYELQEGYRKQITALESLLENQEKRILVERQEIERESADRITRLKEEHAEASNQQAERMAALHQEWLSDLRRLGEFHKEAVEMLRSEQSSAIQHWNEMKSSELNLIRDSSSNIQTLKEALNQLEQSTESLQEIKSWMSSKESKQNREREAALHEREAQLTALQHTLDKEISNVAAERANLTSLARELEDRIAQQKEDSEKSLKAVEEKENNWRREKEEVKTAIKEEKERLQELRSETEADIKKLSVQKAELSTEVTRLEIEKKITEDGISQRLEEIKKLEEEAEALRGSAQSKVTEAQREREIAQNEQRAVFEQRMQISLRTQELDKLAKTIQQDKMVSEEARAEGSAAIAEARRLQREQADNAAEIARQITFLKDREQILCQEKLSLSLEWKRLRDNRARGLCLQCSKHISSHQANTAGATPLMDVVDPMPIIMRLRAERGSDFSDFDLPDHVPSVLDVISQ